MTFKENIQDFGGQPLTRQILLDLLKDYERPYDKISELIRQKMLIRVKRGIFVPGPSLKMPQPESYLLANHLLGPSYVSLETALSYWQLIPEKVFGITSVTTTRSKTFHTQVGRFSYVHLQLPYFAFGQLSIAFSETQVALVATAEKALCDKIVTTSGIILRSTIQTMNWLTEDMLMDRDVLRTLETDKIRNWAHKSPKRSSLQMLAKTLGGL